MDIQKLIDLGIIIITNGVNKFTNQTRLSEAFVYEALMELFKETDITSGKISNNQKAEEFLSTLEERVFMALYRSGYGKAVTDFTTNFDLVSDNVINLNEAINKTNLQKKDINMVKRLEVKKTIQNLTEAGLYRDFIAPVREGLYRNILFGSTVSETEELIRSYVISKKDKDSRLLRYVGQVATDSLHQFDGSLNQTIKNNLGLNGTQYVGSLIEDSRGQCRKWTSMEIIPDSQLQEEIDWAFKLQKEGKQYAGGKVGGMIAGTNPSNFIVNRGGWRCRHRAIGVRITKLNQPKKPIE